jgi:hypothetical protein
MLSVPLPGEAYTVMIAGIDVHKKVLAVVLADVEGPGEYRFEQHPAHSLPAAVGVRERFRSCATQERRDFQHGLSQISELRSSLSLNLLLYGF